jgi:LCP family protein required for cell wall assembly
VSVTAPPRPPQAPPPIGTTPAAPTGPPPKPPRSGIVWRVVLGCVIVFLCSAGGAAVFALGEVRSLRDALSINPSLDTGSALAPANSGGPQTFLLVGNDQRKHTTTAPVLPHDNENLLVRFDPSKPYISMMSIPRELQTTINCPHQGRVTTRLNYSLTCGGIPTMVNTIKQVTGISINHVIEIDFNQFKNAVNEIGCVYSTVDRRYYHVNVPGGPQYQEIDLQPGYQQMCGTQALQFVSYRHGDTSLVRDARDQSFLLDVKKQYGPTLVDNISKFEKVFGRSVQTDQSLHTTGGVLNLIGTLINSSSLRVRQVHFQVTLQPIGANPCSCDTASPQQIAASVNAFLYGGSGLPPQRSVAAVANAVHSHHGAAPLPLVPTGSDTLTKAQYAAADVPFPLEIPRVQDRGGSIVPVQIRDYSIQAPGGVDYPSYVAVFNATGLGQYYDVQGTQWTTPPMLDSPDQTVQVGGRTYSLFYEGQHLEIVAWYEHHAVYWIRNTLTQTLGNGELLAIAEQTAPATSHIGHAVTLGSAAVPQRTIEQTQNSLQHTLGSLGGLVALVAVPLLAVPFFRRRREVAKLRLQLAATLHFETQLAAVAPPLPAGASSGAAVAGPAAGSWTAPAYSSPRLPTRTRVLAGVGAAILAAVGVVGIIVNVGGGQSVPHVKREVAQTIPTVPVAVLNASSTPGAAGRLATQLRLEGVKLANVGNLTASLSPGLTILYTPGRRGEAEVLSRMLASSKPTIQPINPTAQAAAGSSAQLVIVIA